MTRVIALLVLSGCSGCSFLFVHSAPTNPSQHIDLDCTSSRVAPVLDVVGAVDGVASAVALEGLSHLSVDGEPHAPGSEVRVMEATFVGMALLQTVSAAYGFHETAECERAKEVWRSRLAYPPPRPGCSDDSGCKDGRRCVQGLCVWRVARTPLSAARPSFFPASGGR